MADFNPLNWFAKATQLYKAPIVGSFFENPNEAEKQQTTAASAKYFQQQRPEMIQTQQNMLNNRLAQYQGAADVMASMGIPTSGAAYSGISPFGPAAFGQTINPNTTPMNLTPQQLTDVNRQLTRKNEPGWFGTRHPSGYKVPSTDSEGNQIGYGPSGDWTTWSQYTGLPITPVAGQRQTPGVLDPNKSRMAGY
jgi:hypothetical protein